MRAAVKPLGGSGVKNSGIPRVQQVPVPTVEKVQALIDTGAENENRLSASVTPKSTGKTFLQKLGDVVAYNQNMQNADSIMAMGKLFGNEQMQSTGQQMMQSANDNYVDSVKEFQYIAEQGAGGAAKGAENVVNALGYLGQMQNRVQIQQNAQTLGAWGTLTGNRNFKGASEHMGNYAQELKDTGLQDTAKFGTKYQQGIQERYADADITKTGKTLGDVSETVGGLAPSAVMNVIAPGSGIVVSALSAGGNATQEALANGASDHEALAYGVAVGTIEAATEKIFDGMAGLFGKGAADDVIESMAKKLAKGEGAQNAVVKIANGLGEGMEEFISEVSTRVVNELIVDTDDRSFLQTMGDAGYSALMGAVVGGVVQAADGMINHVRSNPKTLAQQAADVAIAKFKAQNPQNKTATANAGAEYRAERPQNVEYPTVPIINLSMQNVAAMNNGVIPEIGNTLRSTAISRARERLGLDKNSEVYIPASNVTRNGEDYVLKITRSSLNKMLSPSNGGIVAPESIAVLENIERIANNGVYFRSEGDRQGRDQIAGYDHLMTTVYIDNQPYIVDMRVRVYDAPSGGENRLYYFTPEEIITTKKVGTALPTGTLHERTMIQEAAPTSDATVPQGTLGVKNEYTQEWMAQTGAAAKPTLAQRIDSMRQQLMDMQHRKKLDELAAVYEKNVGSIEAETILDEPIAAGYDKFNESLEGHLPEGEKAKPASIKLIVRDSKFEDFDGNVDWETWAPNGGRVPGTIQEGQTLKVGTIIDRYGHPGGRYVSPLGVPYEQRALPYIEDPNTYHQYEVIRPIENVTISKIAEAFEQPGGGIQYELPLKINRLIKEGYLREVTK